MDISVTALRVPRRISCLTISSICFIAIGCTTGEFWLGTDSVTSPVLQPPANFETALKENQAALAERNGAPDVALYNIGVILAHPSNPKKDPTKALQAFKTLAAEPPHSSFAELAKTWIQVLEQQHRLTEERQQLAEKRRALSRERSILIQERERLNYANEKSQQLDMEIERKRRQILGR